MAENVSTTNVPKPKGVLCGKCEHLNPPGSRVCEHCEAKLFFDCRFCGKEIQVVAPRCPHCSRRLTGRHTQKPSTLQSIFKGGAKLTFGQFILMLLVSVAFYFMLKTMF